MPLLEGIFYGKVNRIKIIFTFWFFTDEVFIMKSTMAQNGRIKKQDKKKDDSRQATVIEPAQRLADTITTFKKKDPTRRSQVS